MRAARKTAVEAPPTPDEDDDPPPRRRPKFCPWCGGPVIKRWVPNKLLWISQRIGVRAAYVCLSCKVAVRAFKFPSRPLFETKQAAQAEAERDHADLEASGFQSRYTQALYERGKCTCRPRYTMQTVPCPQHAPLPKRRHP